MSDPGRPLIPRELLPAPVQPVPRAKRLPGPDPAGVGRQLSIFGAETTDASIADLAGLLAGPGRLTRVGGTARVAVPVDAAWRVHVLVGELVARGLVVSWVPLQDQDPDADVREPEVDLEVEADDNLSLYEVRTAYSSRLSALARAWPPAPGRLFLTGPRLRLWAAAAGRPLNGGYALGLDPDDDPEIADAALVRAGLAGTVPERGGYYLITGRKRLRRLAELVGDCPPTAPADLWPGGATA